MIISAAFMVPRFVVVIIMVFIVFLILVIFLVVITHVYKCRRTEFMTGLGEIGAAKTPEITNDDKKGGGQY